MNFFIFVIASFSLLSAWSTPRSTSESILRPLNIAEVGYTTTNILIVFVDFLSDETGLLLDGRQGATYSIEGLVLLPHYHLHVQNQLRATNEAILYLPFVPPESIAPGHPLV